MNLTGEIAAKILGLSDKKWEEKIDKTKKRKESCSKMKKVVIEGLK